MEELNRLFTLHYGAKPEAINKLKGAGSNRIYYRLSNSENIAIGVIGESTIENKAFIQLAQHFNQKGLNTPKVFCHSDDYTYYLQEDLGDIALFDIIAEGRISGKFNNNEKEILKNTISQLPSLQFLGAENLDFSHCYPQAEFDHDTVMWDLNYFKYCFLKATGVEFFEPALENDFRKLSQLLLEENSNTFLYRDFQSRNVMIKDGNPFFIDFQGGRKGPIYYDVASFIWQAKANLPEDLKEELVQTYLKSLAKFKHVNEADFKNKLGIFVFFRNLQVLGAYGFRGYFEKKQHFIESIPFAIKNLKGLLHEYSTLFPHLIDVLTKMCNLPEFNMKEEVKFDNSKLTLTINSFSFKKGIPEDNSGNGGGYVFDCRGMNNPGRYDEYKQLTGLDKPVIDFLEEQGEITKFLESIYKLAETHVEEYLTRGFTSLMFNFGCTGGQHRSVYSAQHLAEYLHKKYGIYIKLSHREQNIQQEFNLITL